MERSCRLGSRVRRSGRRGDAYISQMRHHAELYIERDQDILGTRRCRMFLYPYNILKVNLKCLGIGADLRSKPENQMHDVDADWLCRVRSVSQIATVARLSLTIQVIIYASITRSGFVSLR